MADITIGELPQASSFDDNSLLVTENQGKAQKVPGKMIKAHATEAINAALQNAKDSGDFDGDPGQKGDPGVSPTVTTSTITGGHRVSITDAAGTKSFDVKDGKNGDPGQKGDPGVSPTVTTSTITGGHRVSITDATGTKSFDVKDGKNGDPGAPGYTPQRGTDYWTPNDIAEIKSYVDDAILGGEW